VHAGSSSPTATRSPTSCCGPGATAPSPWTACPSAAWSCASTSSTSPRPAAPTGSSSTARRRGRQHHPGFDEDLQVVAGRPHPGVLARRTHRVGHRHPRRRGSCRGAHPPRPDNSPPGTAAAASRRSDPTLDNTTPAHDDIQSNQDGSQQHSRPPTLARIGGARPSQLVHRVIGCRYLSSLGWVAGACRHPRPRSRIAGEGR
jgi:hypothetical protein